MTFANPDAFLLLLLLAPLALAKLVGDRTARRRLQGVCRRRVCRRQRAAGWVGGWRGTESKAVPLPLPAAGDADSCGCRMLLALPLY